MAILKNNFRNILIIVLLLQCFLLFSQDTTKYNYDYWHFCKPCWQKDSTFETGFRYAVFGRLYVDTSKYHGFANYTMDDILFLFGEPPPSTWRGKYYTLEYPVSASLEDCNKFYKAVETKNKKKLHKVKWLCCLGMRYFIQFTIDKETKRVIDVDFTHEDW